MDYDPETGVILSETDDELMPDSSETEDELNGTAEHAGLADLGETVAQVEAEGMDFYLTASDVASLMTERLGKKTTTATFRRMVVKADAPAPAGADGKTVKWSQNTIDAWLDRLEDAARAEAENAGPDAAPDGKDFFLSAAEAAALVSEQSGHKFTVAMFRRMVMAGDAPPAILQAGGTSNWSQAALDEWLLNDPVPPSPRVVEAAQESVATDAEEVEDPKPQHETVYDFFTRTFSAYYELNDTNLSWKGERTPVMVWCQQWWMHKAVMARITAAWFAWEAANTTGGGAMSSWILEHGDRHFDRIMAEDGLFRKCKTGHLDDLSEYPTEPPPPSLLLTAEDEEPESAQTAK